MAVFPIEQTPLTLPGCQLWLDSSDPTTIIQSAGSVSQWSDKSGFKNHMVQPTGSAQPTYASNVINGKAAIQTDGITQYMGSSVSIVPGQTFSIVYLAQRVSGDLFTYGINFQNSGNSQWTVLGWRDNGTALWYQSRGPVNTVLSIGTIAPYSTPQTSIFTTTQSSTTATGTYDDNFGNHLTASAAQVNNFTTPATGFFGNFNGNYYHINVGEIMFYNRDLTSTEITKLKRYLANKWGVALS